MRHLEQISGETDQILQPQRLEAQFRAKLINLRTTVVGVRPQVVREPDQVRDVPVVLEHAGEEAVPIFLDDRLLEGAFADVVAPWPPRVER